MARKAIGMPKATHIAVLRDKNKNKTASTIQRPLRPFLTNNDILSCIKLAAVL